LAGVELESGRRGSSNARIAVNGEFWCTVELSCKVLDPKEDER